MFDLISPSDAFNKMPKFYSRAVAPTPPLATVGQSKLNDGLISKISIPPRQIIMQWQAWVKISRNKKGNVISPYYHWYDISESTIHRQDPFSWKTRCGMISPINRRKYITLQLASLVIPAHNNPSLAYPSTPSTPSGPRHAVACPSVHESVRSHQGWWLHRPRASWSGPRCYGFVVPFQKDMAHMGVRCIWWRCEYLYKTTIYIIYIERFNVYIPCIMYKLKSI